MGPFLLHALLCAFLVLRTVCGVFDGVDSVAVAFFGRPRGRGEGSDGSSQEDVADFGTVGDLVVAFRVAGDFLVSNVVAFFGDDFVGEDFLAGVGFFVGDAFFTTFVVFVVLAGGDDFTDFSDEAALPASIFFAVCVGFLGDLRSWSTGSGAALAFATTLPFFRASPLILAMILDMV